MGAKQCSFFTGRGETTSVALLSTARAPKNERFADPWWRKYDIPTDGFVDSTGTLSRLPLRLESTEVIVYGLVDAKKMWADFEALDEPYVPVLVGGKAVVAVWFKNFIDTDCGGAYLETCYSTFVTPNGEPQLDLPYETPMSTIIQDPRRLAYLQRVVCSEAPVSTGAGAVAVEGGRCIWGFPTHPELGKITFEYIDGGAKASFETTHSGTKVVSLRVDIPKEGKEGTMLIPLELESAPDAFISGPRLGGIDKGINGAQQTRYGIALKCTQYANTWDANTDSLEFGDDAYYANPIKQWGFEPLLKVHSPDSKIVANKPMNWKSGLEAASLMAASDESRFVDDWWRKFDTPIGGFVGASGTLNRLPLRRESSEVIVYGLVDAKKMWVDFEALDEPYVPVLVGGKAVVAVWFKNFIDTDCGGAYLETCYSTFVTRKGVKQIRLPYETPMSALIQDPRSLSYLQRVVCSEAPVSTGAGAVAVEGGRCIWGFPTHPELGKITFDYAKAEDIDLRSGRKKVLKATFEASHLGKKAVSLRCNIPLHGEDGVVTRKLEIETGNDSWIGGPRLGGTHKGHIGGQQTRYGVAFKCTQHVAPWKATTDSLEFGDDDHYATLIKDWNFEPVLKVHSPDFKIIAHKPSNWISDSEVMEEFAKRQ